jgi:3-hydroxybutyrate dehydrogenase
MGKNKVAVITGSTSGIGLAVARSLAEQGVDIMLNGFGEMSVIIALQKSIKAEYDVEVKYHPADMSKPYEARELIAATHSYFGRIDILINNAGIQHVAPIEEFPDDRWDDIIAVNLSSAFHTIKAVTPIMKMQGYGRIINMASIHGMVASPYKSAYVVAKHGLLGLTKTVALELARTGITCNAICPGYVLTPLVENQIADTAKARGISEEEVMADVLLGSQPTRRFTSVEDLGAMALFLCGDAASNITGSSQVMDGGYIAG